MKIAAYHHLPSGGALLHFNDVIRGMKNRGYTVDLYTPETAEMSFYSVLDIIDKHIVLPCKLWEPGSGILNPFNYKAHLKKVKRQGKDFSDLISARDYDLLYMGQCRVWTEPCILHYFDQSIPTVVYNNEPKRSFYEQQSLEKMKQWPLLKKMWRMPQINWMKDNMLNCIKKASFVFCNSEFSKGKIESAYPGISPETFYIGVDANVFSPDESIKKEYVISTVGALDPLKNHGMAIEVAGLKPGGINFKVEIIADRSFGDTAEALKSRANELGVELEILTRVSTETLVDVYRRSYVVVYCPILEPFGIVSTEAQACGTPVLGRNEGGIKETLIDGVGGYRYYDDPKDYAAQIKKWLDDPESYQQISQQARIHIEDNWDKKITMNRLLDRLETICE